MKSHKLEEILQLDTVHGKRTDQKCILTIHHPYSKFQIGILLDKLDTHLVNQKIREFRSEDNKQEYFSFFRYMLCDNGIEFDALPDLEVDEETGEIIGNVFYTKPYCSGDKGSCEKNHEFFRYIVKKGISLDDMTQEKLNFIFSNINSYPRKILGFKTPYEVITSLFSEEFIKSLGIVKIPTKSLKLKK